MRRERRVNGLIIILAGGSVSIYVFHLISLLAVFNRSSRLSGYSSDLAICPAVYPTCRFFIVAKWQCTYSLGSGPLGPSVYYFLATSPYSAWSLAIIWYGQ